MRHLSGLLLCCCPNLVWALSDAQTIPLLHALGEYRAAYPLAINEAKRHNTVAAWATVYQQPEYAKLTAPLSQDEVYAQAWQAAQRNPQIAAYRQFIALERGSRGAQLALDGEYQLVKQQNTLAAYAEFMVVHPDAVQALDALLHVQQLAWLQVQAKNTVAEYDKYLDAFPDAQFASKAEAAAQALAAQPYRETLQGCIQDAEQLREEQKSSGETKAKLAANNARRECLWDLAREVFNDASATENPRASLRLYQFLRNEPEFKNTKAKTEYFTRAENRKHFETITAALNQQRAAQEAQTAQLLAALETQTQQLVAAGERQTQRLEVAIGKLQTTMAVEAMCPEVGPGPFAFIKSACVLAFDSGARSAITGMVTRVAKIARNFL